MEVDGVFTTPVGGDMIESSEGTFEVNVIEHTRDNVKMALLLMWQNRMTQNIQPDTM